MSIEQIIMAVGPHITEIILAVAVPFAAIQLRKWTGIQLAEKDMRALHSALQSGAVAGFRDGPSAGLHEVRRAAINHARNSVPDALRRLGPTAAVLETIAARYVAEARASGGGK